MGARAARAVAIALVMALAGWPGDRVAAAPHDAPTAALAVSRGPGAEACPDAAGLAALVARRLSRDPFDPLAQRKADVAFARRRGRVVAEVRVREPDGHEGRRTLDDRACEALAEAVALALAVAVDPLGAERPRFVRPPWAVRARADEPTPGLGRRAPEPTPAALLRAAPSTGEAPWVWSAGPAIGALIGLAPAILIGPAAGVEARRGAWRVGLELDARFGPPADVGGVAVTVAVFGARLDLAWRSGDWSLGLGLAARAWTVAARAGLAVPVDDARASGLIDLALGVGPTRGTRLELRAGVPLVRPSLVLDGRDVWRAWPLVLGLSLAGRGP